MTTQAINRFNKGLNKDINKVNYPNDMYYHLQNGRVLSDKGSDVFTITNIEGNDLEVDITTKYPGFAIIGYNTIREDIILFLADQTNTGRGKIVLLKPQSSDYSDYNRYTKIITLLENDDLNFYRGFPIQEDMVTGRYESPEIIKIYWTDGLNNLRFLNVAPDIGTTISGSYNENNYTRVNATVVEELEFTSEITLSIPEFISYTTGNLNSGMIQYAYRLYTLNGNESIFSPVGELIPLTKYSEQFGTEFLRGQATGGQDFDTNSNKGVKSKIHLSNEDVENYDRVEIVSLWYADRFGLPNISIIDNKDIADIVYINDEGGTVEYETLELENYTDEQVDFVCQTLATKDNRLFVGNISENYFDLEFDARAYRYDVDKVSTIYNDAGQFKYVNDYDAGGGFVYTEFELDAGQSPYEGTYTATGVSYPAYGLPSDLDAVNTTNILDYDGTLTVNNRNIAGDLGGTGFNVSYTFPDDIVYKIDNNYQMELNSPLPLEMNVDMSPIEGPISINGNGYNLISNIDWIRGSKKSFQRDEIYRFGIIFYDKKGRSSFVSWIGDIRMPSIQDIPTTIADDTGVYARPIYPVFDINTLPTIDGEELDYRIVSVKRNDEDKSVVTQCLGGSVITTDGDDIRLAPATVTTISDYVEDNYAVAPGDSTGDFIRDMIELITPDINFDPTFVDGSQYLDIAGAVARTENAVSTGVNTTPWSIINDANLAFDNDYRTNRKYTNTIGLPKQSAIIKEFKVMIPGPEITNRTTVDSDTYQHYVNRLDSGDSHKGYRGTSGIVKVADEYDTSLITNDPLYTFIFNMRNNIIGYNGNTYEDRLTNSYIEASGLNSGEAYYGDTFIVMYDYLRTIYDETLGANKKLQEVLYIPLESQYNLFYRYDDCYHKVRRSDSDALEKINELGYTDLTKGVNWTDLYLYDTVYSKVTDAKTYIQKPLDFSDNGKFDVQVKYSDLKLNGEERDSWVSFKENNFQEADAGHGAVKSLVEFNDNIFCFQESGVSICAINEKELISQDVGVNLVLGSGGVLDRFYYLSTEIGIQNRNKVIKSLQALYWLDLNKRKIYSYTKGIESLDDLKGLNSYFEYSLKQHSVLTGIYDPKYMEVIFSIQNKKTLSETGLTEYFPKATISFTEVGVGNEISLNLDGVTYLFTASNNPGATGQQFYVDPVLGNTIDNFETAVQGIIDREGLEYSYTLSQEGNNITITSIDNPNNINAFVSLVKSKIDDTNEDSTGGSGTNAVTTHLPGKITDPDTTFFVDCYAAGYADCFEILVNGTAVGGDNVVASSHMYNTDFLNGNVTNDRYYRPYYYVGDINDSYAQYDITTNPQGDAFEIANAAYGTFFYLYNGQNVRSQMYPYVLGTEVELENNYVFIGSRSREYVPGASIGNPIDIVTGIDEFHADLGLVPNSIPMNTVNIFNIKYPYNKLTEVNSEGETVPIEKVAQQRIWVKGLNPDDEVYVRVIGGNTDTGYSFRTGTVVTSNGDIDATNVNYSTASDLTIEYERSSMINATAYGTVLQVEDTEYFDLRKLNEYSFKPNITTKITEINNGSYTINSSLEGSIDLSYWAKYNDNFTTVYNEALQAFTGFYDFIPDLYIKFNNGFFTVRDITSFDSPQTLYRHNVGETCNFYGLYKDTYLDIIVGNSNSNVKEFNNIEFYSETLINGQTYDNITAYSLLAQNDYQQSEEVILQPLSNDEDLEHLHTLNYVGMTDLDQDGRYILYTEGNNIPESSFNFYRVANIRRSVDHWRTPVPRHIIYRSPDAVGDYNASDYDENDYSVFYSNEKGIYNDYDRIRGPYCKLRFRFVNTPIDIKHSSFDDRRLPADRRIVLHQVSTFYQDMIV